MHKPNPPSESGPNGTSKPGSVKRELQLTMPHRGLFNGSRISRSIRRVRKWTKIRFLKELGYQTQLRRNGPSHVFYHWLNKNPDHGLVGCPAGSASGDRKPLAAAGSGMRTEVGGQ